MSARRRDRTSVTSQHLADQLKAEILRGEMRPGSRLRQEEIAARAGTNRVQVREALGVLESQGFVIFKGSNGTWVSTLDITNCQAIYRVREKVEPLVLEESMPHLTPEHLQELETIQEQIEEHYEIDRFLALDRGLHLLMYAGSRVDMFNKMVERFWNTTQHYRRAYMSLATQTDIWRVNTEHRLLIAAIARQDDENATSLLAMHIRRTRIQLAKHPEVFQQSWRGESG